MLHYLGVIEQRTNSILSQYHSFNVRDQSVTYQDSIGDFSRGLDESSNLAQDKNRGLNTIEDTIPSCSDILGVGPSLPMGSDPIFVNPPKLADYSSDEGSGDEGGDGGGVSGTGTRPFTLDELKVKATARMNQNQRAIKSNKNTASEGPKGRRRSTLAMAMSLVTHRRKSSVAAEGGVS